MKKRVCCLLLGLSILCLPVQQVLAAPIGPAELTEEKKEEEKKLHKKLHEKPEPPKPGEKPVPLHEKKEHPKPHEVKKPHEEKKSPLDEKPIVVPTTIPQKEVETEKVADDNGSLRQQIVEYALQFVGNPYKYGGTSLTNGIDCSGFTQAVYAHFGYCLSRSSKSQAASTEYNEVALKESELLPGDLIFYANSKGVVYHVAMYIGDGKVVHAANAKKGIVVSDYSYYDMKPYIARRILE